MKKLLYFISVLFLATTSEMRAMQDDTASEANSDRSARLEYYIKKGDSDPESLMSATLILHDMLPDQSVDANQKKIWLNWIIKKTNAITQRNRRSLPEHKININELIQCVKQTISAMRNTPTSQGSFVILSE